MPSVTRRRAAGPVSAQDSDDSEYSPSPATPRAKSKSRAKTRNPPKKTPKERAADLRAIHAQRRKQVLAAHNKRMIALRTKLVAALDKQQQIRAEAHLRNINIYTEQVDRRKEIEREIVDKINHFYEQLRSLGVRMDVALEGRQQEAAEFGEIKRDLKQ